MKGITPVIAVILLLLITVAMVGFAFVWFGKVANTAMNSTEAELGAVTSLNAQRIVIDGSSTTAVTVRSAGSQSIDTSKITVLIAGTKVTCGWTPSGALAPGSTTVCTFPVGPPAITCSSGQTIRVTAPGNVDEVTCAS